MVGSSRSKSAPHGQLRHVLARQILAGALKGDLENPWLIEQELAQRFGVSRTPIREALSELGRQGLVEHHPNRGVKLRPLGAEQLHQINAVRAVLESQAAQQATGKISQDVLSDLIEQTQQLMRPKRYDARWQRQETMIDREIHRAVREACGNHRLILETERYYELIEVAREALQLKPDSWDQPLHDHLRILQALQNHDPAAAAHAMHHHVLHDLPGLNPQPESLDHPPNITTAAKHKHFAFLMQAQPGDEWPNKEIFSFRIFRYASQMLKARGYDCRMYWPDRDQTDAWGLIPFESQMLSEALEQDTLLGIIATGIRPNRSWTTLADSKAVPTLGTAHHYDIRVSINIQLSAREAIERLMQQGARKIALLAWHNEKVHSRPSWQDYFREALEEKGLPYEPAWCIMDQWPLRHSAGWEGFREIWTAGPDKPDGLMVCDDFLYAEAANAIREMGIGVPEQLRIVTTANSGVPLYCPIPTNILMLDTRLLAAKLVNMAIAQLSHDQPTPACEIIRHRLLPGLRVGDVSNTSDISSTQTCINAASVKPEGE